MFGEECVHYKDKNCLAVSVDEKTAYINLETRVSIKLCEVYTPKFYGNGSILILGLFVFQAVYEESSSEDDSLREMVELAVQRLYEAMNPVMWDRQIPSAFYQTLHCPQELLLLRSI